MNRKRVRLRRINVHTQRIALHDPEQRRARISGACRYKRAYIDISGGNASTEWRNDFFKALRLLELFEVRASRFGRFLFLVVLLRGDDFFCN